ncbi:MAG: YaaL family protein [Clostridia bacterium]|nr:YaaL family protein [Clostridia bacterium]
MEENVYTSNKICLVQGEGYMQEEYIRENVIMQRTEEELDVELIKSIIKTKQDLQAANRNYEFAEGDLIDYYLYQIKANQSKLNYLLKKAKKNGLIIDMIKEIEIRKQQYNSDIEAG